MKKNLLPLLGIAFVVALAATGIFYGLFVTRLHEASQGAARRRIVVAAHGLDRGTVLKPADLRLSSWSGAFPPGSFQNVEKAAGKTLFRSIPENDPLTDALVSGDKTGGGIEIDRGMRGLSIRVSDSAGLMPFIRAGSRVDIQAVRARNTPEAALRTILQNVEVLSVQAPEANAGPSAPAILTVLANPDDADRVALADSGVSIRLLLRNPLDDALNARPGVRIPELFLARETLSGPALAPAVPMPRTIEFTVQVGGVTPAGLVELPKLLAGFDPGVPLQVSALPKDDGSRLWRTLQDRGELTVLSQSRFSSANLEEGRYDSGLGTNGRLSVALAPKLGPDHKLHLRITPQLDTPRPGMGLLVRKAVRELDLEEGQTVLVSGWGEPASTPALAELLFGGQSQEARGRAVMILVTTRIPAR